MSQAYNPYDPVENKFLSALALGESAPSTPGSIWNQGFGGVDTSGSPTDTFGFPQYEGSSTSAGPTHPAGPFQFEPGTWDQIASQFNLNFQNPQDQEAGAWDLAQQQFSNATGGDLYSTLQSAESGNVGAGQQIQSALGSTWPSVFGNAAAPQGLGSDLVNDVGLDLGNVAGGTTGSAMNGEGSPNPGTPDTGATSIGATIGALLGGAAGTAQGSNVGNAAGGSESANPSSTPQQGFLGTILTDVEDFFVRGGLIIIGAVVIVVALWQLLSQHTDVPGPVEVVKDAGTALAAA